MDSPYRSQLIVFHFQNQLVIYIFKVNQTLAVQANQTSRNQTKIWQTNQNSDEQPSLTKQDNWFKSLETRVLLIMLKNIWLIKYFNCMPGFISAILENFERVLELLFLVSTGPQESLTWIWKKDCLEFLWISRNTGKQSQKGFILLGFNLVK